ncbi:hypothetical protein, partial [Klebsiella pneumoniae]|uniref:hypothetical protein n=1 Tax=Klebsiella pneumoniae TaxID=573 RepID=UPI0027319986
SQQARDNKDLGLNHIHSETKEKTQNSRRIREKLKQTKQKNKNSIKKNNKKNSYTHLTPMQNLENISKKLTYHKHESESINTNR